MRRIIAHDFGRRGPGTAFSTSSAATAQDGSEVDPLLDVAADMNSAAIKLAKLHTDTPTQTAQKSALKKLDEIIARLEEEEKQQAATPSASGRPRIRPSARVPAAWGRCTPNSHEGKQWGELPPKERERILQSMNDGFPSHYQKILERYFARLADEKPLADADADRPPPAEPRLPLATAEPK